MNDDFKEVNKQKQNEILKLVTNSFYKELKNYGVDSSDIVTVSVNLLDHITKDKNSSLDGSDYYNDEFKLDQVVDDWNGKEKVSFNGVSLSPIHSNHISIVRKWLQSADIDHTFIGFFPKDEQRLHDYLIEKSDHKYFAIYSDTKHFVGIIGAENIDHNFKKLEMKKFVGDSEYLGKGVGKLATFLFLYYTFNIMNFNKVFIYSLDTNIKNINLNTKFGFGLEGILYGEVCLNGKFRDTLRMGLLKDTWQEIFS